MSHRDLVTIQKIAFRVAFGTVVGYKLGRVVGAFVDSVIKETCTRFIEYTEKTKKEESDGVGDIQS